MTDSAAFVGWPTILGRLLEGSELEQDHVAAALDEMLNGRATSAQVAAFLVAMRAKGETAGELEAMLATVRRAGVRVELSPQVAARSIDIVGTGGDKSNSVNISTMSALVVAAAGVPVCKHGNRASSSACGAADVLEAAGVAIALDAEGVKRCVEEAGFGFCLAPSFHPSFRHVGPTRREIGVPTVFNLLGPMANPAEVSHMMVGVANEAMMTNMARALMSRGVRRAWVVHGHGGLDELSVSGPNVVSQLDGDDITRMRIDAADFGIGRSELADIVGGDADHNRRIMSEVFGGAQGAVRDVVSFNAGCALHVAGMADSVADGVAKAIHAIDSGSVSAMLDTVIAVSQREATRMKADS